MGTRTIISHFNHTGGSGQSALMCSSTRDEECVTGSRRVVIGSQNSSADATESSVANVCAVVAENGNDPAKVFLFRPFASLFAIDFQKLIHQHNHLECKLSDDDPKLWNVPVFCECDTCNIFQEPRIAGGASWLQKLYIGRANRA